MVIDDDPSILITVAEILRFEGYEVATATNGADGLRILEQIQPTLLLLDMRMPVLDGWGFTQTLRERGITLPVLIMTAAQDARRWAEEVNAAGYVAKPFQLLDLIEAVEQFQEPPQSE
ncbi:MAG: response regulator [Herpetosiphonaceae bacterium]|nr:response regulator [Herpetosiphonaceae bacterium]